MKTGKRVRKEKRMTLGSNWVVMALFLETGNAGRGSRWQWGNHEVNFGHVEFGGTLGHPGRPITWESGYTAYVKRHLWARDKTTADTCVQTVLLPMVHGAAGLKGSPGLWALQPLSFS